MPEKMYLSQLDNMCALSANAGNLMTAQLNRVSNKSGTNLAILTILQAPVQMWAPLHFLRWAILR
jgi:hypothetical protein